MVAISTLMNILESYSRNQKTVQQQVKEEMQELLKDEIVTRLSLEERKAYFREVLHAEDEAMAGSNEMLRKWNEKVAKSGVTKAEAAKFQKEWGVVTDRGNEKAKAERKRIMEKYGITEEEDRMIQNEAMTSDAFSDVW